MLLGTAFSSHRLLIVEKFYFGLSPYSWQEGDLEISVTEIVREAVPMSVHGRPPFAKRSVHDGLMDRLHPYIRTFAAAHAAVPDGNG